MSMNQQCNCQTCKGINENYDGQVWVYYLDSLVFHFDSDGRAVCWNVEVVVD